MSALNLNPPMPRPAASTSVKYDWQIDVFENCYVRLVESWGSDESIIEAARMSTDKGFQGWGTPEVPGDEKLLRYLWKNNHATPFEMAGVQIEVQAPIFVFREWHRHRTQSFSELSARYTAMPNMRYVPTLERMLAAGQHGQNKQGSGNALSLETAVKARALIEQHGRETFEHYENLLAAGVAREVARVILPVNQISRMRAQALLRNWLAFLALRDESHAQFEIRQFAVALRAMLNWVFPRTLALFDETNPTTTGR